MKRNPWATVLCVGAAILVGLVAAPGGAASGRQASPPKGVPPDRLITPTSVGPVKLGMTIAEVRRALPKGKLARTTDGEGIALVAVKRGPTLEMILYAGEESAERPLDERAIVQLISVFGKTYRTAEGVYAGMPVKDVEKKYGKLEGITMSEIESREEASFAHAPEGFSFRVASPESGIAGLYPEGKRDTAAYDPSAVVSIIEIFQH